MLSEKLKRWSTSGVHSRARGGQRPITNPRDVPSLTKTILTHGQREPACVPTLKDPFGSTRIMRIEEVFSKQLSGNTTISAPIMAEFEERLDTTLDSPVRPVVLAQVLDEPPSGSRPKKLVRIAAPEYGRKLRDLLRQQRVRVGLCASLAVLAAAGAVWTIAPADAAPGAQAVQPAAAAASGTPALSPESEAEPDGLIEPDPETLAAVDDTATADDEALAEDEPVGEEVFEEALDEAAPVPSSAQANPRSQPVAAHRPREAVAALASGELERAVSLYAALADAHPDNRSYTEAERILRARLAAAQSPR